MPRFFLAEIIGDERFELTGAEARHLQRVMRKGIGDPVEIADGKGRFYQGTILQIDGQRVVGRIDDQVIRDVEPGVRLVLCQALPKGDKMEEIIRKGTEVGVSAFVPFIARRSISRPDAKDAEKKRHRWQRISEEASKQAGRSVIPDISSVTDWAGLGRIIAGDPALIAWEGEDSRGVRSVLAGLHSETIYLIIGPEGGFDPEEVKEGVDGGMLSVSLGPRIMRTETAGPVLAALALYALGEMEPVRRGGE